MMTPRNIMVSWELNNGEKVKFWRDSWNGAPPLIKSVSVEHMVASSESIWGSYLVDFISAICLFSRRVIWEDPGELPIIPQDRDRLSKIFSEKSGLFVK